MTAVVWWLKAKSHKGGRERIINQRCLVPISITNAASDPVGTPGSAPGLAQCPPLPSAEF